MSRGGDVTFASGDFTIVTSGVYLVSYAMPLDANPASPITAGLRSTVDWIPGTLVRSSDATGPSASVYVSLTAGTRISLYAASQPQSVRLQPVVSFVRVAD